MNQDGRRTRRPELRPLPEMLMGQFGGGAELLDPGLMLGLQRWSWEPRNGREEEGHG